ncbi:MAG TPA: regulatory protein RecX [Dokdonella sp.]|nr:regulatory protein RecX [Dokdonella sp.]
MRTKSGPSAGSGGRSGYDRALGLLARREHSERELKAKLVARGHAPDETGEAIDRLQRQDFQSDARFAASIARQRSAQGYGPRRIRAELRSHGLAQAAIGEAIASLTGDWDAAASAQLRRRYGTRAPKDRDERAARAAFLLRRGFDPATVRAVTHAEVDDPGEEFD